MGPGFIPIMFFFPNEYYYRIKMKYFTAYDIKLASSNYFVKIMNLILQFVVKRIVLQHQHYHSTQIFFFIKYQSDESRAITSKAE